jgi:NADPH-dependent 2,4-dienoyl-CoA reductase/sulfur reductase-like enzyme/nitrite reductase/ring-hydroxylating ferredoxin subunit
MGGNAAASGPDFAQGIPELADGALVAGQYAGQAVLAVKKGDEVFVVAANCTHWNENMALGTIVGDTILCPAHHSCFSLRTGDAVGPPALGRLPTFKVERRGNAHVVTGPADAPAPKRATGGPESVVIIGGGAAGAAAADMLRREGYAGKVTMLSADSELPCDRPNVSKDYLAGNAPEEWLFLRSAEAWAAAGVDVRLKTRVDAIDRQARSVRLVGGETLPYGALLLATGAEPVRLAITGSELPHVHLLRTVDDGRKIVASLASAKQVAVIGSSFIGLEVAASLRTRGLEVHVIGPEKVPLEHIVGGGIGLAVMAHHEKQGVVFHLGRKPASIGPAGVTLDDGGRVAADLVVMGVGVRPSIALAEAAGLSLDRGVAVDAAMRTSDSAIWAAGDIARYPDARSGERLRVEHWVVAERQGQTAARAMLGQSVEFDAVPFFWTTQFGLSLRYIGHAEGWDRADVSGEPMKGDCAVAYRRGDRTLAVATLGRDRDALLAADALARSDEAALMQLVPA